VLLMSTTNSDWRRDGFLVHRVSGYTTVPPPILTEDAHEDVGVPAPHTSLTLPRVLFIMDNSIGTLRHLGWSEGDTSLSDFGDVLYQYLKVPLALYESFNSYVPMVCSLQRHGLHDFLQSESERADMIILLQHKLKDSSDHILERLLKRCRVLVHLSCDNKSISYLSSTSQTTIDKGDFMLYQNACQLETWSIPIFARSILNILWFGVDKVSAELPHCQHNHFSIRIACDPKTCSVP
jgi:hypothetical protein